MTPLTVESIDDRNGRPAVIADVLPAIHRATNVALALGFTVEIGGNGHMRFRKGRDTGTAQVLDGSRIGNWRTGDRAPIVALRLALA